MDPQLSDQEQMMLGAQQAALLQIQDNELENKAHQQHAMLEEEKLMEAQHEALALQQQQMRRVQDQADQKDAELHRLQTIAMIEKEQELLQAPPPLMEGASPSGPPSAPPPLMSQPAQPVVFMRPPLTNTDSMGPRPSQTPMAPTPLMSQPVRGPVPAQNIPTFDNRPPPTLQEPQFPNRPPHMQDAPFLNRGPPPGAQEPPFASRGPQPISQEPQFPNRGPPPGSQDAQFSSRGPPPSLQEPQLQNRGPPTTQEGSQFGGSNQQVAPPSLIGQQKVSAASIEAGPSQKPMEAVKAAAGPQGPGSDPAQGGAQAQVAPPPPQEMKLPQALEKMLAFKDVRAQQVGVKPEDVERVEKGEMIEDVVEEPAELQQEVVFIEEDEEEPTKETKKESKNKKRKKKKKRAKAKKMEKPKQESVPEPVGWQKLLVDDVEIEYVEEEVQLERTDPGYAEFSRIFKAFKIAEPTDEVKPEVKPDKKEEVPIKARGLISDDSDDDDEDEDDDRPKMSKKKQKKMNRLSVAELKQLVTRPDVVEMHDVTARDPKLLVHIKATRNSVAVPRHWCFKRKYLQGKRGIEKPPFDLPDFIKATGIMEMRQALQEKEDQKTMKSKMRERVRPKMGKIDIDYKKLHDAFFKWQVKPKLSIHGDLYYEGKEFETRLKEKKPGNLTDELRTSLGMPIGPNSDKYPPPWLIAMQRYGPPPSYPNLKVPGLNAPIPDACAFGYHAGGWGKPPVDEAGKPLYGDVFGTQTTETEVPVQEEEIDKSLWGELESESEEEDESEEETDEEGEMDASGLITPGDAGLVTPSGVTSIPVGVETPDMIELRKKRIEDAMDQGGDTPALYQVIPEKKASVGGAMMGSAHVYDIAAVGGAAKLKAPDATKPGTAEVVEIALNPDELDLDAASMQAKYDQTMREQQSQLEKEDLSDMVAEHAAKQQKKRKKQQQDGKAQKKYKEFKF